MSSPSRLTDLLRQLRADRKKALGIFVTSGFPSLKATLPILRAIDEGGADFIEIGMPFSDPLAEGKPIQRASEQALANGTTMNDTFAVARAFREGSDTPLVLMGYVNPIIRLGPRNFFTSARSSGVDAIILPDLPPEEASLLMEEARSNDIDLIFLIAPTTPNDRMQRIDRLSRGFVYAVSVTGLTGSRITESSDTTNYLRRAREQVTGNPLLVGFGIRTHDDVNRFGEHTDGCIVGSALIQELDDLWKNERMTDTERMMRIRSFVNRLKYGAKPDAPDGITL